VYIFYRFCRPLFTLRYTTAISCRFPNNNKGLPVNYFNGCSSVVTMVLCQACYHKLCSTFLERTISHTDTHITFRHFIKLRPNVSHIKAENGKPNFVVGSIQPPIYQHHTSLRKISKTPVYQITSRNSPNTPVSCNRFCSLDSAKALSKHLYTNYPGDKNRSYQSGMRCERLGWCALGAFVIWREVESIGSTTREFV